MVYAPTTIDLSRVKVPAVIETQSFEALRTAFIDRFIDEWTATRITNPALPIYDAQDIQADPYVIAGRAWSTLRLLDRQRVNDAIKALLPTEATRTDLDAIVVRQNVERLEGETDLSLLRRYLLSFDKPSAGSAGGYMFDAYTAFPDLLDVRVNGRAVHGRRGDTDVVVIGPGGAELDDAQFAAVTAAVLDENRKPEAVSVAVLKATRREYDASFVIEVPPGPDAELVRVDAEARVRLAAVQRMLIGGEIPDDLLSGAAYGPNIIKVRDLAPVLIEPDPYTVPILRDLSVTVEVRA
jgi:phage-related baseplate assembly protein